MKLILRLERNGELLGEWPLDDDLRVALTDPDSGAVVAELQVRPPEPMDELALPGTLAEELTITHTDLPAASMSPARAEVWSKGEQGWAQKGVLNGGQRARMGNGIVRLEDSGDLLVSSSESLTGFAFLPSGRRQPIDSDADRLRFPAGSSVTLESGTRSFYVRSDFVDRPLVEHSEQVSSEPTQELEPLRSDLN